MIHRLTYQSRSERFKVTCPKSDIELNRPKNLQFRHKNYSLADRKAIDF